MFTVDIITLVGIVVLVAVLFYLLKRQGRAQSLDASYDLSEAQKYHHRWGYVDTRFEFDGPRSVRVTGSRYPLSGFSMPSFVPFIEEVLDVQIRPENLNVENRPREIQAPALNEAFMTSIETEFKENQYSIDPRDRLVHSHGQLSVDEVYQILYGTSVKRVVDLVLYPEKEEDIGTIIQLADEQSVCLMPYGGGTNVSGALACPSAEDRMIVSVDMRRMNRILWVDEENFQACVEAGITGKQLEKELDAKGYTSGHDPDSIEFSTLGGWISTNASGMKKNRYGNIEDIVLEATLITPTGNVETRAVTPRNSIGSQPRSLLFGSEGNFGIITKAVIKIHPRPRVRKYGSLVFPTFERGVNFLRKLRTEGILPASIRLLSNNEFRFGQALKPEPTFLKGIVNRLQRFFLLRILGFDSKKMVACTILMEGSRAEVSQQERSIFSIAKKHKGKSGGAANGKRGYTLTFGIAYIRDFCNECHVLGETFETSVPWNRIHHVCQGVERGLVEEAKKRNVPGKPYLSYRVTQTYHTGVCIYFTMGLYGKGMEKPADVFHEIEGRLRQIILDNGGSLSHHHGVGKVRQPFLSQVHSENSINVLRQSKKAMDPNNTFGIRNGVFGNIP